MARHDQSSGSGRSDGRRSGRGRPVEPARKSPASERSLTHSPYFQGPLYERMSEDLHLAGMAKRTHEGYLRAVRTLADFCRRTPDQISPRAETGDFNISCVPESDQRKCK